MRWLKKGLPSVTAPDGRIANGGDAGKGQVNEAELAKQEKADEDVAMGEMGTGTAAPAPAQSGPVIPALDEEQEYEWKWKVSPGPPSASWIFAVCADIRYSPRWRCRDVHSSCSQILAVYVCMYEYSFPSSKASVVDRDHTTHLAP